GKRVDHRNGNGERWGGGGMPLPGGTFVARSALLPFVKGAMPRKVRTALRRKLPVRALPARPSSCFASLDGVEREGPPRDRRRSEKKRFCRPHECSSPFGTSMSSQVEAADSRRVLTIAIGLDATGLDSIRRLIPGVSLAESLAVIVVARRGCVEHPALVEALRSVSPWPVVEAGEKDLLAPATIFLAPPECDLEIRDGRFVVEPMLGSKHGRADYPFDRLFRSLARELGANVAGVVLAGEGSDGIAGLREIRAAGGFAVIARSEHDAVSELVRDAIEIGGVDLVLSASELADAIERFRRLRHDPEVDSRLSGSVTEDLSEDDVAVLAGILRSGSGFDISHYKTGTVCRRLVRRMALLGVEDRAEYLRRLRNCEIERRALIQDLMIGVTDFFRDEVAFETLRRLAIEPAIDAARSGGSSRARVAGCATGEEAYSSAIELLDAAREGQKELSVQIFATDVDERAVAVGRAGIYPSSIIDHIAPERLEKHF